MQVPATYKRYEPDRRYEMLMACRAQARRFSPGEEGRWKPRRAQGRQRRRAARQYVRSKAPRRYEHGARRHAIARGRA